MSPGMAYELSARGWLPMTVALVLSLSLMMPGKIQAADNLNFTGNLVAEACTIRPGDEALQLRFDDLSQSLLVRQHPNGRAGLFYPSGGL